MPKTASTATVEDKARQFLSQGWSALYESDATGEKIMDKQVVYLRGLIKKKSRAGLTDEQIRLVQRLVKGEGTKEEASTMISAITKQHDGADNIASVPEMSDNKRDVEEVKTEVKALLERLDAARETYQTFSVIAEPSDPDACVYCDKTEDEHATAVHEFEAPEPEAVLSYAAQEKVLSTEVILTEYLAQFVAL